MTDSTTEYARGRGSWGQANWDNSIWAAGELNRQQEQRRAAYERSQRDAFEAADRRRQTEAADAAAASRRRLAESAHSASVPHVVPRDTGHVQTSATHGVPGYADASRAHGFRLALKALLLALVLIPAGASAVYGVSSAWQQQTDPMKAGTHAYATVYRFVAAAIDQIRKAAHGTNSDAVKNTKVVISIPLGATCFAAAFLANGATTLADRYAAPALVASWRALTTPITSNPTAAAKAERVTARP